MYGLRGVSCGCGVTVPDGATCPTLRSDCGGVVTPITTLQQVGFLSTDLIGNSGLAAPLAILTMPARAILGDNASVGSVWGLTAAFALGAVLLIGGKG